MNKVVESGRLNMNRGILAAAYREKNYLCLKYFSCHIHRLMAMTVSAINCCQDH